MSGIRRGTWRRFWVPGLLALAGCRGGEARHPRVGLAPQPPATPAAADTSGPAFGDTLLTLDSAAVVLFWTAAVDTLDAAAREEAAAELRATAAWADDYLEGYQIPLHATHAHGVMVRPPTGGRRFVDFRGLDYPFGFVLIEPGYPEQFLTGLVTEDDLRDALIDYFDLEEDDSSGVYRTGWPVPSATIPALPWRAARPSLTLQNVSATAPVAGALAAGPGRCRTCGGPERRHGRRRSHHARPG